jgi:hypothetical protein
MSHTPDGPLPVRWRDNEDRTVERPTAAELADRVRRLGSRDEWIVVDRVPQLPHDVVQACFDGKDAALEVSFRIGDDPWMEARLAPDRAAEVFVAWARDEPGWEGDHPWALAEWWQPEPVPEPDPAVAAEARELAARYLVEGYLPFEEMVRQLHEMSEADPPLTAAQASVILTPMWRARAAEQADWGTTDCDRITAAFADLDRNGIVARERFSCCQNCGTHEIWEEAGPDARGYAFFHMQDAETAVDGGLYLSYGSRSGEADEAVAIGHEVVKTLGPHGLRTEWDGSVRTRVLITDLNWQKRLP